MSSLCDGNPPCMSPKEDGHWSVSTKIYVIAAGTESTGTGPTGKALHPLCCQKRFTRCTGEAEGPRQRKGGPKFGTWLKTQTGEDVQLLPTKEIVPAIEAGCSADRRRARLQTLATLLLTEGPRRAPPVIFLTTHRTHADDLNASVGAEITNQLVDN